MVCWEGFGKTYGHSPDGGSATGPRASGRHSRRRIGEAPSSSTFVGPAEGMGSHGGARGRWNYDVSEYLSQHNNGGGGKERLFRNTSLIPAREPRRAATMLGGAHEVKLLGASPSRARNPARGPWGHVAEPPSGDLTFTFSLAEPLPAPSTVSSKNAPGLDARPS